MLHLLYLYPLIKEIFPNYRYTTKGSSLRISSCSDHIQTGFTTQLPSQTPSGT